MRRVLQFNYVGNGYPFSILYFENENDGEDGGFDVIEAEDAPDEAPREQIGPVTVIERCDYVITNPDEFFAEAAAWLGGTTRACRKPIHGDSSIVIWARRSTNSSTPRRAVAAGITRRGRGARC